MLRPPRVCRHDAFHGRAAWWGAILNRGATAEAVMRALFPTAAACEFVVEKHGAVEEGKQTLERLAEFIGWGSVKD